MCVLSTKTPPASIRRIVQVNSEFFKIRHGLWALKECENEVLEKFSIKANDKKSEEVFTHSYYQGIVVDIGNLKKYDTYVPAQDKNKMFLEKKLGEIATIGKFPEFSYKNIVKYARTVDVIWFNERGMPCGFYEIEHTTNIKNSLSKFYELQDFRAVFSIVADKKREEEFNDIISASIYKPIKSFVNFISYDKLVSQYEREQMTMYDVL